jgi:hypothetical protein
MRSLRFLAGEPIATGYYDESDRNNNRFDEIIEQHFTDPEEYCERGLESYLSEKGRSEISEARKLHKLQVITEHTRQVMLGRLDADLLRSASLAQSRKSSARARTLALTDQREARETSSTENKNKNNKNVDMKQNMLRQQPQKLYDNTNIGTEMTLSGLLWCRSDHECIKKTDPPSSLMLGRRTMSVCTDTMPCSLFGHNPIEHIHRNETRVASAGIPDTLMKQKLFHLLLKQEHESNQHAESYFCRQHENINDSSTTTNSQVTTSILASLQMQQRQQQQERFLHHQQQQLQNQRNYQQQEQRILLLRQHQEHYESIQLASAAILGRCRR